MADVRLSVSPDDVDVAIWRNLPTQGLKLDSEKTTLLGNHALVQANVVALWQQG